MEDKGNAIMIAIGKPKAKHGMGDTHSEPEGDEADSSMDLSDEEKAAAEAAYDADTPEEYGQALKAFIKFCMKQGDY